MKFGDLLQLKIGVLYNHSSVRHWPLNWPLSRGCFAVWTSLSGLYISGEVALRKRWPVSGDSAVLN